MEICVQRRSAIGDPRKMPKPIVAVGTVPQRLIIGLLRVCLMHGTVSTL
jgi:hypothetical protein